MGKTVGIDLGTTNSLMAYYDDGEVHIIPNRLGKNFTPSCISVDDDGTMYVGEIAKERLVTYPSMSVADFKRYMGTQRKIKLGKQEFLPEELSSFVIRSLIEDAEIFLKEKIEEAVISVPAYFNDAQRKATKRAGELCGLKVERIVNEPTAAAIAYGIAQENERTKYLIIDLGGGTYDVSLLEINNKIMEVRGVAGDNFFGGNDFTEVLMGMFINKLKLTPDKLTLTDIAILKKNCDAAKTTDSLHDSLTIRSSVGGELLETSFGKVEFETACENLLARLRKPIEKVLHDTKVKAQDIDHVVLVGGGAKLYFIKSYIAKLFGKFPDFSINAEEVVVMGAAVQAAMKARNEHIRELILIDVCPYTLGTNVSIERENGKFENGHYLPIIDRNTVIPVSRMATLTTINDNQREIRVKILQGESRLSDSNIFLGELIVNVPAAPAGHEAVEVRYTYDINGILEVVVHVLSTGLRKKVVIEQNPGSMSQKEIEDRLSELEAIKIHPRNDEFNKLLLSRAERLYEENTGNTRMYISQCIHNFEKALDTQNTTAVMEAQAIFKQQLDSIDTNYSF